jgi:hypothetical protein
VLFSLTEPTCFESIDSRIFTHVRWFISRFSEDCNKSLLNSEFYQFTPRSML